MAGGSLVQPAAIATAEAFGTAAIGAGAVAIAPTGIATAEAFGSAVIVGAGLIAPTGIATAEAFGSAVIQAGGSLVQPAAIPTAEAFGTPTLTPGAVSIAPAGIATAEAFGTLVLSSTAGIAPTGIGSAEAFGSPVVAAGGLAIVPTGIGSAEAFGSPTVALTYQILELTGIGSAEAFGSLIVSGAYGDVRRAIVARLKADPALAALVGSRIYAAARPGSDVAAPSRGLPAITYRVVSEAEGGTLDGPDGTATVRIQLDCWAQTEPMALEVRARLRALLHHRPGDWRPIVWSWGAGTADLHEFEQAGTNRGIYHLACDFMVKHRPSA
jgi:hypothetical protein